MKSELILTLNTQTDIFLRGAVHTQVAMTKLHLMFVIEWCFFTGNLTNIFPYFYTSIAAGTKFDIFESFVIIGPTKLIGVHKK